MAKLLAYYNLCPINNLKEFLGLSKDLDSGSVINTLGKNIVLIIKVNSSIGYFIIFLNKYSIYYIYSS